MKKKPYLIALIVIVLVTVVWAAHHFDGIAFLKHLHGG